MFRYYCNLCKTPQSYNIPPFDLKCALNPHLAIKEFWEDEDWKVPIGYCVCGGEIKPGVVPTYVSTIPAEIPRYSVALGVFDEQLEDAKKLHPQVSDWKKFGNSWRPLIRNDAEKRKMMKQADFEEYNPNEFKGRQR